MLNLDFASIRDLLWGLRSQLQISFGFRPTPEFYFPHW